MNVVIYARFSSHSQTEQSIEGQLKVCYETSSLGVKTLSETTAVIEVVGAMTL